MERFEAGTDISDHLPLLYEYALPAKVILELGVRTGVSTRMFLQACEQSGGKMVSIDINDCSNVAKSSQWQFIRADDLDVSLEMLPAQVDVLFIDTSHTFSQTLAELLKFSPIVKPGGVIIMHDTELPEVKDAIHNFLIDCNEYQAVFYNNCHGLGVLKKCQKSNV